MSEPKNRVWKRYICRQLNPCFGNWNINTQGYKKCTQKPVASQRESDRKCRWLRGFWLSYFLAHFVAVCYYCFSNNSRTVRLILLASGQRKIRRNFRRIFCTCCEWVLGMREHSFPKIFPYFFPLAVFTLRAIWYIRYILKTDLNLMIPDVVVWQLMDRVKQIRIPYPSNFSPWENPWISGCRV